ncbi:MAG: hypothetical protein K8I27_17210 [Planctomycetes bacterium]|nr:hypothetical protein [Planctomycetota bacterium]
MNGTGNSARKGAVVASLLSALLLVGCGGGLTVVTPEIDDARALAGTSSFYIEPVAYDFQRDPDWELSDGEWKVRTDDWSNQFANDCSAADKAVYTGTAAPQGGARVELLITAMNLGTYAFFYKAPGWIQGILTIKDGSGKVIFRGAVDSPGTTQGSDRYSLEGRIKVAHSRVARDVRWLINRTID